MLTLTSRARCVDVKVRVMRLEGLLDAGRAAHVQQHAGCRQQARSRTKGESSAARDAALDVSDGVVVCGRVSCGNATVVMMAEVVGGRTAKTAQCCAQAGGPRSTPTW